LTRILVVCRFTYVSSRSEKASASLGTRSRG